MSRFVKDEDFREAHELPTSIDFTGKGEMVKFATPDGGEASAYVLRPEAPTDRALLVFQEWWGLNDYIRQEADRLFDSLGNVLVIAPDLYDGKVATTRQEASAYMGDAKPERIKSIIRGALAYAGDKYRVATIGWCFGGGWSLKASILAGEQGAGCVMYYGMPVESAAELAPLQADVLGIFAKRDGWINEPVVTKFEGLAKATAKQLDVHWFDAEHAFANPSSPRYNSDAAHQANQLAVAFLRERLE